MIRLGNIAGTTYNNDPKDGGRPRQEILARIFRPQYGQTLHKKFPAKLIYTNFKGEPAIKVKCGEEIVGWIPKAKIELINNLENPDEIILVINYNPGLKLWFAEGFIDK